MLSAAGENQDSDTKKGAENSRPKRQGVAELASRKNVSKKSSLVVVREGTRTASQVFSEARRCGQHGRYSEAGLYLAVYESGRVYLERVHQNPNESP